MKIKNWKKKRDTISRDKWEQKGCFTKTKKFLILPHRADVGYAGHFCTALAILAEFRSRFHNILEMLKSPEITCKCYVSIYEFFWENAQKFSSDSWPKIGAFCLEMESEKSICSNLKCKWFHHKKARRISLQYFSKSPLCSEIQTWN